MREQFTVDLRGLVEILSHHLYRNERVYLRELVQNAHDAIQARAVLGHAVDGEIEIVPARGYEQLVVRDNGIGLTEDDMLGVLTDYLDAHPDELEDGANLIGFRALLGPCLFRQRDAA